MLRRRSLASASIRGRPTRRPWPPAYRGNRPLRLGTDQAGNEFEGARRLGLVESPVDLGRTRRVVERRRRISVPVRDESAPRLRADPHDLRRSQQCDSRRVIPTLSRRHGLWSLALPLWRRAAVGAGQLPSDMVRWCRSPDGDRQLRHERQRGIYTA